MSIKNFNLGVKSNISSKFGKTFKVQDGELQLDPLTGTPIFTEGRDNLAQTLERALLTAKYSNIFHPLMGLDMGNYFASRDIYTPFLQQEIFESLVHETIMSSTPYGEYVNKIAVQRSNTNSRVFDIRILLNGEVKPINISSYPEKLQR